MSSNVDVQHARELLEEIGPALADEERALRTAEPELGSAAVLERALRRALERVRATVSGETFVYLYWRAEQARRAERADGVAPTNGQRARDEARGDSRAVPRRDGPERSVCDATGRRWAVREAGPNELLGATSPRWLTFVSAGEARHTSAYLPDWTSLPDAELVALLPRQPGVPGR